MTQSPIPPHQPQPQIVTKPGGLSGAAHAVHILICFVTCGLWIPGYLLFILLAPDKRVEVIAPYGTDPQAVAIARAHAEQLTPQERKNHNTRVIVLLGIPVGAFVLCAVIAGIASLFD